MREIARVSHGANYFNESEYFHADPHTGVITNRAGKRIVCLTDDFLHGFHDALVEECGPAAELVLHSCGRATGDMVGRRLQSELSDHYGQSFDSFLVAQLVASLRNYFSIHGWGRMDLDLDEISRGLFTVSFTDAPFQELFEATGKPLESMLAGFLSGVFSCFTGQELRCVQTRCQSTGAESSLFLLGLEERLEDAEEWVEEGVAHDQVLERLATVRV